MGKSRVATSHIPLTNHPSSRRAGRCGDSLALTDYMRRTTSRVSDCVGGASALGNGATVHVRTSSCEQMLLNGHWLCHTWCGSGAWLQPKCLRALKRAAQWTKLARQALKSSEIVGVSQQFEFWIRCSKRTKPAY